MPEAGAAAASDQSLMCTGCPGTVGNQTKGSWEGRLLEPHLSCVMVGIGRGKTCWVMAWETLGGRQGGSGVLGCGGVSGSLWDFVAPGPHEGRQWVSLRSPMS